MGAGSSKPGDASKHVFSTGTPVQFSQELVDSLQASSETNSSRAKTLELHIAERVAAELERIQKRETETLESVRAKLSSNPEPSEPPTESTASKIKGAAASALPDALTPSSQTKEAKDEKARQAQSSKKVQDEIAKLKKQLADRKVLNELPPDVEKARSSVITCLRLNDRRPLDCWKEVEVFKQEVRKMEEKFVGELL